MTLEERIAALEARVAALEAARALDAPRRAVPPAVQAFYDAQEPTDPRSQPDRPAVVRDWHGIR